MTRGFSFVIPGSVKLSPPGQEAAMPPAYEARNPLRQRLEDAVEDVFHAALERGDLASAQDLLGVLESIHVRARVRFRAERKGTALMIDRARNQLGSRKARRRPDAG
jgi:hypothetical protein